MAHQKGTFGGVTAQQAPGACDLSGGATGFDPRFGRSPIKGLGGRGEGGDEAVMDRDLTGTRRASNHEVTRRT